MLKLFCLFIFCVSSLNYYVQGHGMVMEPVNRASRWRFDPDAVPNYTDNELFCGGMQIHHGSNGGKCGLCGDNYADATPRNHELGGVYGQGVIVRNYKPGDLMPVQVKITANHLGFFIFNICDIDKFNKESEECFEAVQLKQPNGDDKYFIASHPGDYDVLLKLPEDLQCQHCVLRWSWTTGNTWGQCEDGTYAKGCGPQETFKTCSDIRIML